MRASGFDHQVAHVDSDVSTCSLTMILLRCPSDTQAPYHSSGGISLGSNARNPHLISFSSTLVPGSLAVSGCQGHSVTRGMKITKD